MRAAYRNDEDVVRLHLESLLDQHRVEASSLPAPVRLVHARRLSRSLAGVTAILGAFVIAVLAIYGLLSGKLGVWGNVGGSSFIGQGGLTVALLAAWALVAVAYLAGRLLSGVELRRLLAPVLPSRSGDIHADYARLAANAPRARLEDQCNARERHSVALPLAGFALLAPLTLHLGVFLLLSGLFGSDVGQRFKSFDGWIAVSVVLVGHAHAVLAYLAFRFAGRICKMDRAELEGRPRPNGWEAFGITVVVSAIPGVLLYLMPPLLTAITGLFVGPPAFAVMRERLIREREILEAER